jgi:hypothetical protein
MTAKLAMLCNKQSALCASAHKKAIEPGDLQSAFY